MGLMDDAKDKLNDAENEFHEQKGEMQGRIDQAQADDNNDDDEDEDETEQ